MPETKTEIINGIRVLFQKCWNNKDPKCRGWFQKTRKDRVSCSDRCAIMKSSAWKNRNKKAKTK